jgi:hypothetical protein
VSPTIPMSCCAGAIGGCSSPGRSTRVRERPMGSVAGSVLVRDGSPDHATVHRGQSLLRVLKRRQHLKPVF